MKNAVDGSRKQRQEDRVTYSETVKVNVGNYESKDIFVSFSTDLNPGESVEDALKRARAEVTPRVEALEQRLRKRTRRFVDFDTMAKIRK